MNFESHTVGALTNLSWSRVLTDYTGRWRMYVLQFKRVFARLIYVKNT